MMKIISWSRTARFLLSRHLPIRNVFVFGEHRFWIVANALLMIFLSLLQEFHEWKAKKEDEEQTSFRAYGRAKNKLGETVEYFQCNRSGVFKSRVDKELRKRHAKTGGIRIHFSWLYKYLNLQCGFDPQLSDTGANVSLFHEISTSSL